MADGDPIKSSVLSDRSRFGIGPSATGSCSDQKLCVTVVKSAFKVNKQRNLTSSNFASLTHNNRGACMVTVFRYGMILNAALSDVAQVPYRTASKTSYAVVVSSR